MATTPQSDVHGNVLSFADARALVQRHADALRQTYPPMEQLALLDAVGRVLASEIRADRDFPPFARATRDGYAVRSEDLTQRPSRLRVIGQLKAGGALPPGFNEVRPGEAVEIMTGAPVPDGADAVVMVEFTDLKGTEVTVKRSVAAGENIVPRGSEAKQGDVLLSAGSRLSYPQIAVAASVGAAQVEVFRRPRIAILSTGDEVVPITATPATNQIRNSNSFSLAAQVLLAGGEPLQLPVAPDEPRRLQELIAQGLAADLLLLSGGVSMGKYDLVERVLSEFSAKFFFTGCNIQPGKPLVFGRANSLTQRPTYFFGLPGNPVSTMVTFELFAREFISALGGARGEPLRFVRAKLLAELRTKTGLTRFLPALLSTGEQGARVELLRWQGSGDIVTLARANCYVVVQPERYRYEEGESITVLLR